MKIDPKVTEAIDLTKVIEQRTQPTANAARAAATPAAQAQVSLSGVSSTLQELETRLTAEPAFDARRVQEIKDAIRSGQFRVNPEAIADRLIESVREIVGKSHG